MIHGITFDQQLITSANMAHFMWVYGGRKSGVTNGCDITREGLSFFISAGYLLTHGRMTQISDQEEVIVQPVTSGTWYGYLVYQIDLSKINTREDFTQGSFEIVVQKEVYPTLVQDNLEENPEGKYQFPMAKFTQTPSGITEWTDIRVFFDNDLTIVNVPASGWTGENPYTNTVPVTEMISRINPNYGLLIPDDADGQTGEELMDNFSYVGKLVTGQGNITLTAYGVKPTVDFQIMLAR